MIKLSKSTIMKTPFILTALSLFQKIQHEHKDAHIGGSIGLFLHGIVLPRDWHNGPLDLDITLKTQYEEGEFEQLLNHDDTPRGSMDMDLRFLDKDHNIKVEMQFDPESNYVPVMYKGFVYHVKTIEGIMYWKEHYAEKYEEKKHIDDLNYLKNGYILSTVVYNNKVEF